jgi:UDP-3-O-[3-hydroxymyristoyl] glucosamine N-acyltransferase
MVKNLPAVERSTKIRFGKNVPEATDQAENTIVFNASNVYINAEYAGSIYMTPLRIREDVNDRNITVLTYNRTTKEVMDSGAIAEDILQFDLEDATRNGNTTSNTIQFVNPEVSFITTGNVGIANGAPTHTLDIGSNLYVDEFGLNVLVVSGNVAILRDLIVDGNLRVNGDTTIIYTENTSIGDAFIELGKNNTSESTTLDLGLLMHRPGALSNVAVGYREGTDEFAIAYTASAPTDQTFVPRTDEDIDVHVYGRVFTEANVGIINTNPIHTLDVGSNLYVDDLASNILVVRGNVDFLGDLTVTENVYIEEDLLVVGNTYVNRDLRVVENAFVTKDLTVTENAFVTKDLTVTENAFVSNNLTVTKDLTVTENAFVTKDLTVTENAFVSNNLTVTKDLTVTENAFVSNNLTVTKDLTVTENAFVSNNLTVTKDLTVTENAFVSKDLTVTENAFVSKDLTVTENAFVSNNLTVTKDLTVTENAFVSKDLTVTENAFVTKDLTVTENAFVSNNLTVTKDLTVTENAFVSNNLTVTKDLTVTENAFVSNNLTVTKDLTVTENAFVSNNLTVTKDLTVTENAFVSNNLTVTKDLTVTENAFVSNNLTVTKDLTVTENAFVSNNLTVTKDLTVTENAFVTKDLTVTENVFVSNNLTVTKNVLVSNILTVTGNTHLVGPNVFVTHTMDFLDPTTAIVTDQVSNVQIRLGQLENVSNTASNPLDDQVLMYDGGEWTNIYPNHSFLKIKNDSLSTMVSGNAVYVSGYQNENLAKVKLAKADSPTTMPSIGIVYSTSIAPGEEGLAVAYGKVNQINTNGYNVGETLYVSNLYAGWISNVKPYYTDSQPNLIQNLGVVTRKDTSHGAMFVTGIGRANDIPNAELITDYNEMNYVYVNDTNNDLKKITSANLNIPLTTAVSSSSNSAANAVTLRGVSITSGDGFHGDLVVAGNVTVDTNTLKVDAEANRVGLGTTNPTQTLDVRGSISTDDYLIHNGDTNTKIGFSGDDTFVVNTNGTEQLKIDTNGNTYVTSNLSVDTNTLHIDSISNRVGILTTAPGQALDVRGAANVGALTATSASVTGLTHSTSKDTGILVVTQGGLGVEANIHSTNVFAASHIAVGTSDTSNTFDVRGTANVGALVATSTHISDSTTSTSTTSGALQVRGGVSTQENLNVGGVTKVWDTTAASNKTSGALQVLGGVGIDKDLYATDGHFTTDVSVGSLTNKYIPYANASKILTDSQISQEADGTVVISNDVEITGTLLVSGDSFEVSAGELVVQDRIIDIANNNPDHALDIGILLEHPGHNIGIIHHGTDELTIGYTQNGYSDTHILQDYSNHITMNVWGHVITQNTVTVEYNDVYIVGGGLGIGIGDRGDGKPHANIHVVGNVHVTSNISTTGNVIIDDSTSTTSKTTGALQVTGGVGVQGDIYATNVTGTDTVKGATLTGTSVYGTLSGSNTAAVSDLTASGTVKGGTLTGTSVYGTISGSNTAAVSDLTASGTVKGGTLTGTSVYGTLSGSNTAAVSDLTASGTVKGATLTGTSVYGTIEGSNTAAVSDLTASGTVKGGTLTGTSVYGTISGSNTAAVSDLTASGTVKGGTLTGTSVYGTISGSNTAAVSDLTASGTVKGATLTGTSVYGTISGSNTAAVSDLTASGTVKGATLTGTSVYGTIEGSNTAAVSDLTASGTVKGATLTGTSVYGTISGSNTAAVSDLTASGTVKGATLTGTSVYGTIEGSNTAAVSDLTASGTVKGATLTGTSVYGTIEGSNTAAVSTLTVSGTTQATSTTTGALTVAGGISTQTNVHAANVYISGGLITNTAGVTKKTYAYSGTIADTEQPYINVCFTNESFSAKIDAQLIEGDDEISTISLVCCGGNKGGTFPTSDIQVGSVQVFGPASTNPWSSAVVGDKTTVALRPSAAIDTSGEYHIFVEYLTAKSAGAVANVVQDTTEKIVFGY